MCCLTRSLWTCEIALSDTPALLSLLCSVLYSEKVAAAALAANGYNLERALDDFYSSKGKYSSASSFSSSSSSSKVSTSKLSALFDQYRSDEESIEGEELQKFFQDLNVPLSGPLPLALAWQYKCANFASVDKKEFMNYYTQQG